ncbi:MAG: GIY-YIG nuclease family protein [Acidobacteria bacterium]|nr:GIY-YIG nuclease family protein [Acidobacteriota bacterium]
MRPERRFCTLSDRDIKQKLFNDWAADHIVASPLPFFDLSREGFFPSEDLVDFLLMNNGEGIYLYILFIQKSDKKSLPLYIGKTVSLYKRWVDGHIKKLQECYANQGNGSYEKWQNQIVDKRDRVFLGCVQDSNVRYPPIPNFPKTIGAIEYQLISLANDVYPNILLNSEGVRR